MLSQGDSHAPDPVLFPCISAASAYSLGSFMIKCDGNVNGSWPQVRLLRTESTDKQQELVEIQSKDWSLNIWSSWLYHISLVPRSSKSWSNGCHEYDNIYIYNILHIYIYIYNIYHDNSMIIKLHYMYIINLNPIYQWCPSTTSQLSA